uniref:Uncharacterized protein n=1 Tax=Utricularia reniformis TaxID=192314 RepID=A0A1Y0B1G1_9LAMI|nr:hypothetical protein AEK19_MT1060 [Utricularia reniformis]ART31282.1 hypothetical protein AEK19_MT1060 [Utricularia reniformis]
MERTQQVLTDQLPKCPCLGQGVKSFDKLF